MESSRAGVLACRRAVDDIRAVLFFSSAILIKDCVFLGGGTQGNARSGLPAPEKPHSGAVAIGSLFCGCTSGQSGALGHSVSLDVP